MCRMMFHTGIPEPQPQGGHIERRDAGMDPTLSEDEVGGPVLAEQLDPLLYSWDAQAEGA
jgi:hypothetical protein